MGRLALAAGLAALTIGAFACSSSPTTPDLTTAPAGATIIEVLGINGDQSFSPNPATVPTGTIVSWHNADSIVHRVVLNDGQIDTGNIDPGTYSQPMTMGTSGPYHCSIHPEMTGTIVGNQ